jgi:hypothetical protein
MAKKPRTRQRRPATRKSDVNLQPLTPEQAIGGIMTVDPERVRQAERESKAKKAR